MACVPLPGCGIGHSRPLCSGLLAPCPKVDWEGPSFRAAARRHGVGACASLDRPPCFTPPAHVRRHKPLALWLPAGKCFGFSYNTTTRTPTNLTNEFSL